ncbi:MAG: HEAT repeat domain-containing protein [Cyclobacteriaceae bacterium]|nr:HEAT repeat domain-containing protein [Cyclobacteriaceae bacterium]
MRALTSAFFFLILSVTIFHCAQPPADLRTRQLNPSEAAQLAQAIQKTVAPQVDSGLVLTLWGSDSLVADPVSIDIDDMGRIYYTRTNRQKNSEFDIRGHQDWEIGSIQLQTIEDKRAFLKKVLAPELSDKNTWLADLNGDGSHDWRDLTVQKEHVYRIEDTDGDGVADKSQLVVEDFNDETTDAAGGVLKHGDDLFVAIGPDLWRIQENKWGLAEKKTSLSHGYGIHIGFGGHGMSGIEVGPDGRIYWQIGDIGFNGAGPDGKKYEHPNSGVIVRSEPDGSNFEVFAYGNRNTHEFVFDEYGNMISEDNDGDHPGESERLVYVVDGADIGWRTNWQFGKYRDPDNNTYKVWMDEKMHIPRHEGQPAYILPTIKNFVNGPTGMLYNPGTALGERFKNTFFIVEFVGNPTRSGIHAFKLKPKGASFEFVESRMILSGVLATGIDFGPDGALYLSDWIEGWGTKDYGRIWKLDVNNPDKAVRAETEKYLRDDFSKYKPDALGELLKHADMRVRQKAQFELASRKQAEIFKAYLSQKENRLARVHSVWGLSQIARKDIAVADNLVPCLKDEDAEIRAQAARWIGDVRYAKAATELVPLLKDEAPRVKFFAAEALGRIAYEPAFDALIELLQSNNDTDEYIRHAAALALARIGKADKLMTLSSHPSKAVRLSAVLALRRLQHPGIAIYLNDVDEFIVTETARAINDDLSIPDALPALAGLLNTTSFDNEPLIRRSINANLRVGTDAALQNLLAYTLRGNAPAALRSEAIAALSTWAKPSVLDRVDGRYRGEITRALEPVQNISAPVITKLLTNRDAEVRKQTVKAAGKLKLDGTAINLLTVLKNDANTAVRVEALRALAVLKHDFMKDAITTALADKEKDVRVVGLDMVTRLDLDKAVMVKLLGDVISTRTTEERQAAITALGTLPLSFTEPVFQSLVQQMENKKLQPELQLELSEAIDSTRSDLLKKRFYTAIKAQSADSLDALYAGALSGGDPGKGGRLFWSHPTAQCIRCHAYDDAGGIAGPRINGVANKLSRKQLLEALIKPSARIAPGYGMVTLELKSGKKVIGILQEEKPEGFVIKPGDKADTLIARADVAKRTDAPSSMPPMQYLLTKRELRDVVSFLATLKEE